MASDPQPPESPLNRTPNCLDCDRGREHTICHVLHLVDNEWVIEHYLRGQIRVIGQADEQVDGVPGSGLAP